MKKAFTMRILKNSDDTNYNYPVSIVIPKEIVSFCERTAELNHGQNLYTLNKRGGLSPLELISVLHGTNYCSIPSSERPLPEVVLEELKPYFS